MSDMTEHQIDQLLQELSALTGNLGKLTSNKFGPGPGGRSKASDTLERDFRGNRVKENKTLVEHFTTVRDGTKNAKSLSNSMFDLANNGIGSLAKRLPMLAEGVIAIGGAFSIFKELNNMAHEYVGVYRKLNDVGQTFGGSMVEMSIQAGAAGLPLEEFANIIKANSVVVKQYGTERFFELNKAIRKSIDQYGDYGLTLEQLGDMQGTYLDIQRKAGTNLSTLSNDTAGKGFHEFLDNISSSSQAFGTSRDAATKLAATLLSTAGVTATERLNIASGMKSYNTGIQNAIGFLSGVTGGEDLAKGLSDTIGSAGGAVFTELGKQLNGVGLSDLSNELDDAQRKIKSGANAQSVALDLNNKFQKRLNDPAIIETLQRLAISGNEAANQMLLMGDHLKHMSAAEVRQAEIDSKNKTTITALYSAFESLSHMLTGSFTSGFLKVFSKETTDSILKSLQELAPNFEMLGNSLGTLLTSILTKQSIETFIDVVSGLIKFTGFLADAVSSIAKVVSAILSPIEAFENMLFKINKTLGEVVTAFITVGAFFAAKKMLGAIGKFFGMKASVVNIKSAIVNIDGGVGGLGGGGSGKGAGNEEGKGKGRTKGSLKIGGVVAEEKAAEKFAEKAVSKGFMGKMGGMIGKIPGLAKGIGLAGKAGGMLLPGLGIAASGAASLTDSNNLGKGLYGGAAAVKALGLGLDATGVGALAGVPLELLGDALDVGGIAADATGFGKDWFKGNTKPSKGKMMTPDSNNARVIDDRKIVELQTYASHGNAEATKILKQISDDISHNTAILASTKEYQRQNVKATKDVTAATKSMDGSF